MTRLRVSLSLVFALCAVTLVSACSGSGDDDDADSPGPTPTPFAANRCQVAWVNTAGSLGIVDTFVVDRPIAGWTSGVHDYDTTDAAVFYKALDLEQNVAEAIARSTAGTFSLTVAGSTIGASASFSDLDGGQIFFAVGTTGNLTDLVLASDGQGTFVGVLSDTDPDVAMTMGSGTISLVYDGSPLVVGSTGAWAVCYAGNSAFASMTAAERLRLLLWR